MEKKVIGFKSVSQSFSQWVRQSDSHWFIQSDSRLVHQSVLGDSVLQSLGQSDNHWFSQSDIRLDGHWVRWTVGQMDIILWNLWVHLPIASIDRPQLGYRSLVVGAPFRAFNFTNKSTWPPQVRSQRSKLKKTSLKWQSQCLYKRQLRDLRETGEKPMVWSID